MNIILGVENFGKIKHAEVNINSFTVFVGNNNSGKTYLMQLIYGIQKNIRRYMHQESKMQVLQELKAFQEGNAITIDNKVITYIETWINAGLKHNKEKIVYDIFHENIQIGNIYIRLMLDEKEKVSYSHFDSNNVKAKEELDIYIKKNVPKEHRMDIKNIIVRSIEYGEKFQFLSSKHIMNCKERIENYLSINVLDDDADENVTFLREVCDAFLDFHVSSQNIFLPASRTGLMMLYKHFFANFADDNIKKINLINDKNSIAENNNRLGLTQPVYEFIRFMQTYMVSSIMDERKMSLLDFVDRKLIDGKLIIKENMQTLYQVGANEAEILPLYLSSSMINELAPIIYILQSQQVIDSIIWDEIETSLHPEKQLELARLLVRMNNAGYKLIVSTHSDTMASKINNLCLLSNSINLKKRKTEILEKAGLEEADLLQNPIHVYQFVNFDNGKSEVKELQFDDYRGFDFTLFNDSIEKLFHETRLIME